MVYRVNINKNWTLFFNENKTSGLILNKKISKSVALAVTKEGSLEFSEKVPNLVVNAVSKILIKEV